MRKRIKKRYLDRISKKEEPMLENSNMFDKIERSILKILTTFGLIVLLLLWGTIPIIVLTIIGVDYTTLGNIPKVMISFLNDILLLLLLVKIYWKTLKKDFQILIHQGIGNHFKLAFCYWLIGMIVMVVSNHMISIIMDGKLVENEEAVRALIQVFPLYMAFQLLIYAPITEELIFRKSIRDIFQNKYLYVIVSALVFGGLHVVSSITSLLDLLYLIPYCALGAAFALLYIRTNNIFSSMMVHAFHNGLALILYLMMMVIV